MSTWDVFISYASEDRAIATAIAARLEQEGVRVWIDQFALRLGDSLRRSIEKGLATARHGIVLLSPAFLQKEWPQRELDGLLALEQPGERRVLPVWHNLSREYLTARSPILADRFAVSTAKGLDEVVRSLLEAIQAPLELATEVTEKNISPVLQPEFELRVTDHGGRFFAVPLNRARMTVGRSSHADIQIAEELASRNHFALCWDEANSRHILQDWGHPNTLTLNGAVVTKHTESALSDGDEVSLGQTVMRYQKKILTRDGTHNPAVQYTMAPRVAFVGKTSVGKTAIIRALGGVDIHKYPTSYSIDWMWIDTLSAIGLAGCEPTLPGIETARLLVLVIDGEPFNEEIDLFNQLCILAHNPPRVVFVNKWEERTLYLPKKDCAIVRERVLEKMKHFVSNIEDIVFGSACQYMKETDTIAFQALPRLAERISFHLEQGSR